MTARAVRLSTIAAIVGAAVMAALSGPVAALDLKPLRMDNRCVGIQLDGDIRRGEAAGAIKRIDDAMDTCATRNLFVGKMPGGSVNDAIAIGEAIRSREYVTVMQPSSICASACGLIYLGGVQRYWRQNARFIIHRPDIRPATPFKSIGEENRAYDELKLRLIRYVATLGGNPDYVEAMYSAGSKERTLENVDLTRLGLVTLVGAPF